MRIIYSALLFLLCPALILTLISYHFTGKFADDAVYYHLFYGVNGAGITEYWQLILQSLGMLIATLLLTVFLVKKPTRSHSIWWLVIKPLPFICLLIAIVFNPATLSGYGFYKRQYDAPSSYQMAEMSEEFQQYYQQSGISLSKDKTAKNLLLIYAESLERTYFDEALFPGLMPELKKLEQQALSFTNIVQLPNTGWTIAGIVASHCGLPLVTPSGGNTMQGIGAFYPKALCLTDLLKQHGYNMHYLSGDENSFAGTKNFLFSHSYQTIDGKKELAATLENPNYLSAWGLYDDTLFELLYQRFEQLSQPFVLTALTLDTHNPHGHESASCKNKKYASGRVKILNAVHCTDSLLAELIKKIQSSEQGKDTVIVLLSDHLAQRDNGAMNLLSKGERRNLLMIIPPNLEQGEQYHQLGSTLDVSSTLLPFIGFEGEVGLGKNLLSKSTDQETVVSIHKKLNDWWPMIASFWGFPAAKEGIIVRSSEAHLLIANQKIKAPVLLSLDTNLNVVPYFEKDGEWYQARLADRFYANAGKLNILLERCSNLSKLQKRGNDNMFCLLVGKDKNVLLEQSLTEDIFINAEQLRRWLK